MAGIDTTSPHYKGKYASIYEVNVDFPNGGSAGDYVDIQGFAHYWNAERNNWLVNQERDEYWDELLLAASAAVERIDKKLTDEITDRKNSDEELWEAINNIPSYEELLEADKQLSQRIAAVENVVEEWPTEKLQHTIKWGDTPSIVAVGDTIQWPTEVVEWNPKIEKYNEEDTIEYEKVLECANGDEVEWETQDNWSKSELGNNKFIITFSYPVGEYKEESNLGSERIVIVPPVNEGKLEKVVKVTYPWYINNTPQTKLIPIGAMETTTVILSGSPKIKIPFANSQIDVKAEVMAGQYMPVSAWKTGEETINGVTYKTYYKEDSYSTSVSHKITITIKR